MIIKGYTENSRMKDLQEILIKDIDLFGKKCMVSVSKNYSIVEVLRMVPSSLPFLIRKGLCGLGCIENDTASLEAVAKQKGFSDAEIDSIIMEINRLSRNGD